MSDELDILLSVAARLEAAGIPYMVTGSMAANFYTTPRMTRDIDLVLELSEEDIHRVVRLFQDEYYIDRDMVQQAVRNRSMFNMIHSALVVKVDCVVRKDSEYRREEFGRRRPVAISGRRVFLVAPKILFCRNWTGQRESLSDPIGRRSQPAEVRARTRYGVSESLGRAIRTRRSLPRGLAMNDTPPEVEERYRAMLLQRTGEERLIMGCTMRDTARAMVEASAGARSERHGEDDP